MPNCDSLVPPNDSIATGMGPMVPSPLRSCWKLSSSDCKLLFDADTMPVGLVVMLPLASVFHTLYWLATVFQPPSQPPLPAPRSSDTPPPKMLAVTAAPLYLICGPAPPATGNIE